MAREAMAMARARARRAEEGRGDAHVPREVPLIANLIIIFRTT